MRIRAPKIDGRELLRNKNFQPCTRSWSLRRISAYYLRTRSINSSCDTRKRASSFIRLFPSPFFLDVLDSTFFFSSLSFSGINQDKCLGNIVGQRLAGTGNGSLWSDTDMYFVWLGEFFFSTILALITVSDIRDTAFTNPDYKIPKLHPQSRLAP